MLRSELSDLKKKLIIKSFIDYIRLILSENGKMDIHLRNIKLLSSFRM